MSSTSAKQRRFMQIAAHSPKFAKEAGIDQDVAQEFFDADQQEPSTVGKRRAKIGAAIQKVRTGS